MGNSCLQHTGLGNTNKYLVFLNYYYKSIYGINKGLKTSHGDLGNLFTYGLSSWLITNAAIF